MSFTSLNFPLFFIVVCLGLLAIKPKSRWIWLIATSCWFYMAFIPAYILILVFLIAIDYASGILIENTLDQNRKKQYLTISLLVNVGLLASFKYLNFFIDNSSSLLHLIGYEGIGWKFPWALPIGLSFHTFQSMAYTIEVYYGRQKAERHLGIYALYVLFFPQMVAGPIERPQNLLNQFHRPAQIDPEKLVSGMQLIAWGAAKKILVADRLSIYVDSVYASSMPASPGAWLLATYFFAFQIYCDFSGYTDMARGLARLMGYELMVNFDDPYCSQNPSEFWRRWHISLSSWFRDYLFIPLGGSRKGEFRACLNLMVIFMVSGLWHGASWNFVIWGGLHGMFLVAHRLFWKKSTESKWALRKAVNILVTFNLVAFTWIFFRATNLSQALNVIQLIAKPSLLPSIGAELGKGLVRFGLILILALEVAQWIKRKGSAVDWFKTRPVWIRWSVWYALVLVIIVFGSFGNEQFIYFQF